MRTLLLRINRTHMWEWETTSFLCFRSSAPDIRATFNVQCTLFSRPWKAAGTVGNEDSAHVAKERRSKSTLRCLMNILCEKKIIKIFVKQDINIFGSHELFRQLIWIALLKIIIKIVNPVHESFDQHRATFLASKPECNQYVIGG